MKKRTKKKSKPGPAPQGLGPPFTIRLSEKQHKYARELAGGVRSIGEVIRLVLKDAWAIL